MPSKHSNTPTYLESRSFWLLQFDTCMAHGDLKGAIEAQERLRAMGVDLVYRNPPALQSQPATEATHA
jgi:hypothetical protein